jgi:SPP1 family predicted phage head-tail adaptor
MVCQSIKPNINKICIANLNKKIKIQFTYSAANNNPNSNATTAFKDIKTVWAMIKTRSTVGVANQFVNNVNTSRAISHDFFIRWDSAIDFEKEMWIEYNNKRFKIDTVENIDEEDKFVRLSSLERGIKTIEANQR